MREASIEFKGFSFKYDAQKEPTLTDINLTIYKGEKVLIAGPSGSGKSTLAQLINGLIPNIYKGSMTGSFTIDGKEAFNQSIYDKSQLVSTVLQDTDGQFIGLSVAEDLAFSLENDNEAVPKMKERVAHWANRLELDELLQHRPQDLSGGQKQRVSLGGVLIDESPILLFDEPLANLDPKSGQDTIELIDRIHHEEGTTTLIIEHRLEDVLYRPVDRVILINQGSIIFNGQPDELLANDLLHENGIREPLYITVLRNLGWDFKEHKDLSNLSKLDLPVLTIPNQISNKSSKKDKEPLLIISDLNQSYPTKKVLKNINFTLYKGERVAIVGKNGAGKSSLAKSLCKLVPSEGNFVWEGQDITDDSIKERASRIGYVLQNPNQMISQTLIFDEVALGLRLRGYSEDEIKVKVHDVLKICSLYEFRNWPISALSYGQKKRVTIAAILVLGPEMIVLDEPTAGQDQATYTEMMTFLDKLNQAGHTIVMITHDMALMVEYADRALVVVDGKLIADLPPTEVLTTPSLLSKANLKPTSLFELGKKIGQDAASLMDYYIEKRGNHV